MNTSVGKKPARSASPVVRALFDAIDASGYTYTKIASGTGVSPVTLSYWKHGKNAPRWVDFENVARFVGCTIRLEREAK